jgi:hypothetical protein
VNQTVLAYEANKAATNTQITMSNQPVVGFSPLPTRKVPLLPRPETSPKRNRAATASDSTAATLPPNRRKAPKLKPTNSYLFAGISPLYTREVIEAHHDQMRICCAQPGCEDFTPKIINRSLSGTNNYKTHYQKYHPGIPLSAKEEKEIKAALRRKGEPAKSFFEKPKADQTYDETFRTLLLEWIIKNNLSFSLVDQLETKALIKFLNPNAKQISRRTLMRDLKARYQVAEEIEHQKLQNHVNSGGHISLTTNGWAGNNKLDYIAVTGHFRTKQGEQIATLLDIIELTKPIHDGPYLCEKLLEVTNRLGITCAILAIIRDNASPNNTMLNEFEACVHEQWEAIEELEQAMFCCKFNRTDGDVRYCAHIYNIAVQAGIYENLN